VSLASHSDGQASVETVALLPLIALVGALLWQALLVGQAAWLAGSAAHGAARAQAIGADPRAAAARVLPRRLRTGLSVRAGAREVHVRVGVPALVGGGSLVRVSARAHLQEQAQGAAADRGGVSSGPAGRTPGTGR
jgi:hypothetical protein